MMMMMMMMMTMVVVAVVAVAVMVVVVMVVMMMVGVVGGIDPDRFVGERQSMAPTINISRHMTPASRKGPLL